MSETPPDRANDKSRSMDPFSIRRRKKEDPDFRSPGSNHPAYKALKKKEEENGKK